ncbi:DgyrCDS9089 [Dimorphilus gyrociliatus]|uniref:DgyrCDS9089 n=1 Tax=Dimorphilus gyrociliatus TaxID=2664684 RepID=A0A7I8VWD2_9ANNE|nr:DgyrCDS9089 [Dimorphilus gyrociliatus]
MTSFEFSKTAPKIFYCTRTHKQIAQVVKELRRTVYKQAKMSVLASREHTCIHPSISKSRTKNEECRDLLRYGGCPYWDKRPVTRDSLHRNGLDLIWDVEDLVKLLSNRSFRKCPYFSLRDLAESAEIIFAPYNYLIDPTIRKAMSISVEDSVIIIDEGHNIEDICKESVSMNIKSSEIADSLVACEKLIETYANFKSVKKRNKDKNFDQVEYLRMLEAIKDFLIALQSIIKSLTSDQPVKGSQLISSLNEHNLTHEKLTSFETVIAEAESCEENIPLPPGCYSVLSKAATVLNIFHSVTMEDKEVADNFRLLITSMEISNTGPGRRRERMKRVDVLNLLCLSPSVAFQDIAKPARAIILTSGTLTPMQSFQSELGSDFPVTFEGNHVISPNQAWVGNICHGEHVLLKGVYSSIRTEGYMMDVGSIILKMCQEVPYGILVFFPSYSSLRNMKNLWEERGLLQEMANFKLVEMEASERGEFEESIQNYYDAIDEAKLSAKGSAWPENQITGAIFFAVVRGKVSEGIDFSDERARAVLTISIPYPNYQDIKVKLKQEHNNIYQQSKKLISGGDWYEFTAFRALNQALGRCIRHKNDWGIMLMVEMRITEVLQRKANRLPRWFRSQAQTHDRFPEALDSIQHFVAERMGPKKSAAQVNESSEIKFSEAGGFIAD